MRESKFSTVIVGKREIAYGPILSTYRIQSMTGPKFCMFVETAWRDLFPHTRYLTSTLMGIMDLGKKI